MGSTPAPPLAVVVLAGGQGKRLGLDGPKVLAELCGDLVSMNLVLQDDVDHVEADAYLMTHTTNPSRSMMYVIGRRLTL